MTGKRTTFLVTMTVLLVLIAPGLSAQIVDSTVAQELRSVFPELRQGYIDLNRNGEADRDDELDEFIAESSIKDSLIQGQEILDFILENYRFIPVDKLEEVERILSNPRGVIPELVALNYGGRVADVVELKRRLDEEGLYLTPSARREALQRIQGHINDMVLAYKKEGKSYESHFVSARDKLFSMIEQGYPLPDGLTTEDQNMVASIMINTIIKESRGARAEAAIKTLGRLKAPTAAPYLAELVRDDLWKKESINALGKIGDPSVLPLLMEEYEREPATEIRAEIIRAMGRIPSDESRSRLKELAADGSLEPELIEATLAAAVDQTAHGAPDLAFKPVFTVFLQHEEPRMRTLAVEGLGNFHSRYTGGILLPLLTSEADDTVREQAILSLEKQQTGGLGAGLVALLKDPRTSDHLREVAITTLGRSPEGRQGVLYTIQDLASDNPSVRRAAEEALVSLYDTFAPDVVGALVKTLPRATDRPILVSGTDVLARIADPAALNTLILLLANSDPEVKKNVTWGLYRMRSAANPRVIDELAKLVNNETETLSVRINATRALGVIPSSASKVKVWEILVNAAKIRGDKYLMLRYFAVEALGDLGKPEPEVIAALSRIAGSTSEPEVGLRAIASMRKLAARSEEAEAALVGVFKAGGDREQRIRVVEALGDMRSAETAALASVLLEESSTGARRILYALSQVGGEKDVVVMLAAASERELEEFIEKLLEDLDAGVVLPVIRQRRKSEKNERVLELMDVLEERIQQSF